MNQPTRRLISILTLGALAGVFVFPLNPVNSTILRLAFLACLLVTWGGVTILVWRWKRLRTSAFVLPMFVSVPFLLPGGEIDGEELRQDFVRRLASYEGTRYYWGGESPRGIDCSGLPRRALRDALLAYAAKHLNSRALRECVGQWWFDASAKSLGEGFRDYTIPLEAKGTIRKMDYGLLVPGDLAISVSGVHVLVYLGEDRWIQADPGIGAVATLDGRTDENSWFRTPVTTHRWRLFSQGVSGD